jgi:hypothetical protein
MPPGRSKEPRLEIRFALNIALSVFLCKGTHSSRSSYPHGVDGLVHLLGDHVDVDLVCRHYVLVPQQFRDHVDLDTLPEKAKSRGNPPCRRSSSVPFDVHDVMKLAETAIEFVVF